MVKTLPLWSSRDWVPEIWEQRRIEKFPYSKVLRERYQSNPIFNYSLNLRNPTRRTAHRMSHLRSNQSLFSCLIPSSQWQTTQAPVGVHFWPAWGSLKAMKCLTHNQCCNKQGSCSLRVARRELRNKKWTHASSLALGSPEFETMDAILSQNLKESFGV